MIVQDLEHLEDTQAFQALLAGGHADPRALHDAVRTVVTGIEASQQPVPAVLRRALEELEADIAEAFFNNVPV